MIVVRRRRFGRGARRGPGFGLPPADTGSWMLDRVNSVLLFLLHLERRLDPFFRRPFDAVFRGPLTALTTKLINWKRRRERGDSLGLAEERSSRMRSCRSRRSSTFHAQLRGLWKPGHFERGGNTKTHGIVRAEFTSATTCRRACGAASSRSLAPFAPGFASPGPGRTSPPTSTTSAS